MVHRTCLSKKYSLNSTVRAIGNNHENKGTVIEKTFVDFHISVHRKWRGTRLSSPKGECTNYF